MWERLAVTRVPKVPECSPCTEYGFPFHEALVVPYRIGSMGGARVFGLNQSNLREFAPPQNEEMQAFAAKKRLDSNRLPEFG